MARWRGAIVQGVIEPMHSHAQTQLTKGGFSDLDARCTRHDAACQYISKHATLEPFFLSRIEAAISLAKILPASLAYETIEIVHEQHLTKGAGQFKTTVGFPDVLLRSLFTLSVPIRTRAACPIKPAMRPMMGFYRQRKIERKPPNYSASKSTPLSEKAQARYLRLRETKQAEIDKAWRKTLKAWRSDLVPQILHIPLEIKTLVEVKIKPVSTGDAIRQLKLYREFLAPQYNQYGGLTHNGDWLPGIRRLRGMVYGSSCQRQHSPEGYSECNQRVYEDFKESKDYLAIEDRIKELATTLLVTDYDISSDDALAFDSEGIKHVRLGPGFEAFLSSRTKALSIAI